MNEQEKKRFARQMNHSGFGAEEQKKLRGATVLLAGVGGLGGAIAYGLVSAGIGKLILIHSGFLEDPDLNRQTLMKKDSIGRSRVKIAAERLREFSEFVEIEAYDEPITEEVLARIGNGADIFIDARHNFPERRVLNRVAVEMKVPLLFAAMDGFDAQSALFLPEETGCLDCLYPEDPEYWDPFGFPVFGAVAHTIGAISAMKVIHYLTGSRKTLGKMLVMNLETMETRHFPLRKHNNCPTCGGV